MASIQTPRELFSFLLRNIEQASAHNSTVSLVLLGVIFLCGGVYAFAGQKTYRPLLMSTGILLGAVLGHVLFEVLEVSVRQQNYARWGFIIAGATAGMYLGPRLLKLAFFVVGGSALTLLAYPGLQNLKGNATMFAALFVFVAGGTLAMLVQRFVIAAATSVAGAYLLTFSAFALGIRFNMLQENFPFNQFYIGWALLAVIALVTQLSRKSDEKDD